ncbi:MAG: hypothetical protein LUE26_06060 [Alistipes sp.]|nr:hypothetical protein [Alistipes sp.]
MTHFDTDSTAVPGYAFRRTHTGPVAPYSCTGGSDRPVFTVSAAGYADTFPGEGQIAMPEQNDDEWD